MVSRQQVRWKGPKGDIHSGMLGSVSRVGIARVVPILSADMGYAGWGLQERGRGWRMRQDWGIVDGGGCEKRVVVTCDIAFITHLTQLGVRHT